MLETIWTTLLGLFEPMHLLALLGGVLTGMIFGAVPGLNGITGLALLLPFMFTLDASTAVAMAIGLLSVVHTTDTIPAVLFGVPGTSAAQATILDGQPLARQGQAQRALAVAFVASMVGGLFGSLVLGLSLPILRPLVLAFGSPELFMVGLTGITMVAALSSGSLVRGLLAGSAGLMLSMVGLAKTVAFPRWTFGGTYLMDGLPLVAVVLGVFAVPEVMEMYIRGKEMADRQAVLKGSAMAGVWGAIREVWKHKFLVLRCSLIGSWVGFIPGLGTAVVDWFAYSHAMSTERGARETFGKGDIRGVMAPESANNSTIGGDLIPTLAFGIPGSTSMALFLTALMHHNITPGPSMLTTHRETTLLIIWSLAIANVLAGTLCLLLTRQIALITTLPAHYLTPVILVVIVFGSFQVSNRVGDLIVLLVFSVLGWCMKATGWPRPPLILGFVLGPIIENYLVISLNRYGATWVTRPLVVVLALCMLATIISGIFSSRRKPAAASDEAARSAVIP